MPYEDLTGTIVRKICMACSREFTGVQQNCPHDGNMLMVMPTDQWEGRRLANKFLIKTRLGTGGMGVVYLAWHELMQRWVAIKMLKQSFVEDQASVRRFQQEATLAGRLNHANVITLHDFGVTDTGQPYMVMDYLVGYNENIPEGKARSLAQMIKEQGQLPVEKAIHIISQACEALDHAHRNGVIHRDVKPANIMIVPTEEDPLFVKVVDFGVAKLLQINNNSDPDKQSITQMGEVCGSPVYMSPEQCIGQALDSRADIYSMGVVLFETLTGKLPLVGRNMVETMQKHMKETPPTFKQVRPDLFISERVEQVVRRAMAKEPHERQQSMNELAQDLQFSIPRPGQTPSLKAHELLPPPADEKPAGWLLPAIGGAAAVILCIAGFLVFGQQKPAPHPAPQVVTEAPKQPAPNTVAPTTAPVAVAPPAKTTTDGAGAPSLRATSSAAADVTQSRHVVTKKPPRAVRVVQSRPADEPVVLPSNPSPAAFAKMLKSKPVQARFAELKKTLD